MVRWRSAADCGICCAWCRFLLSNSRSVPQTGFHLRFSLSFAQQYPIRPDGNDCCLVCRLRQSVRYVRFPVGRDVRFLPGSGILLPENAGSAACSHTALLLLRSGGASPPALYRAKRIKIHPRQILRRMLHRKLPYNHHHKFPYRLLLLWKRMGRVTRPPLIAQLVKEAGVVCRPVKRILRNAFSLVCLGKLLHGALDAI